MNWISRSIIVFFDWSITALIVLSFPLYSSSTILMFYLPLCLLSPLIHATSPIAISICLWLFFILCLSLRERKYFLFHQFKAAFLQHLIYRCRFLITLPSLSNCSSGIVIACPCIRMLSVNTGYSMSSSIYISHQLFKFVSVSSMTSCSCSKVLCSHLLYINIALLALAILSNCLTHHGALLRLNFHFTCSVTKKSCILSSL